MKNMNFGLRSFCVFLLYITVASNLSAQDLKADLLKMQAAYLDMTTYHGKVTSKTFMETEPLRPSHTQRVEIWKKEGKSLTQMDRTRILLNDRYLISVDDEHQMLSCKLNPLGAEGIPPINVEEISLLLEKADEVIYKGITKGSKCYIIKLSSPLIDLIELYLDAEHYLPVREVRHYVEGNHTKVIRSVMSFQHLAVDEAIADHHFSEKQFIKFNTNKEVQPVRKFQDYYLVLGDGLFYVASTTN